MSEQIERNSSGARFSLSLSFCWNLEPPEPLSISGNQIAASNKNEGIGKGVTMAYFERIRDIVSEPLSPDAIRQRAEAGWQMVAIEWRRELPDAEAPTDGEFDEDIPYGLRISDDCMRLEADPVEHQVLMLIMEGVAQDSSYAEIAARLNEKGLRTRSGQLWTRVAVFGMIPRLIDFGPRIFSSTEWVERSRQFNPPRPAAESDQPATQPKTWRSLFGLKSRV
jgi:hypothetical protein